MTIEEAIFDELSGDAGVAALVGTRIYPIERPQGTLLPAITVQRITGTRFHCMGSDTGVSPARFQITGWGKKPSTARDVIAAVQAVMNRFTGTMGSNGGVTVQAALLDNESDIGRGTSDAFGVIQDYIITYEDSR